MGKLDQPDMSSPMSLTPNPESLTCEFSSVEQTLAFGQHLGQILKGGDVLALTGDLGVGKTLMTRGVALGCGLPQECVNSPTFSLIQVYDNHVPLIHIDLYRLESQKAILQLGLDDYFIAPNIVIIEWADRFIEILPPDYLEIHLEHGDTETLRSLSVRSTGPRSRDIVLALKRYIV